MSTKTIDSINFYNYDPTQEQQPTNANESISCFCMDPENDKNGWFAHNVAKKVKHIFHKNCLKKALTNNPTCPNCRSNVELSSVFSPEEIRNLENKKNNAAAEAARYVHAQMAIYGLSMIWISSSILNIFFENYLLNAALIAAPVAMLYKSVFNRSFMQSQGAAAAVVALSLANSVVRTSFLPTHPGYALLAAAGITGSSIVLGNWIAKVSLLSNVGWGLQPVEIEYQ